MEWTREIDTIFLLRYFSLVYSRVVFWTGLNFFKNRIRFMPNELFSFLIRIAILRVDICKIAFILWLNCVSVFAFIRVCWWSQSLTPTHFTPKECRHDGIYDPYPYR